MSIRVVVSVSSILLAACSFSPSGGDVVADDGRRPDAELDATIAIDAIDAPTDAALDACSNVCVGNVIESCGAVVETCAAGCSTVGVACRQIIPSNGVTETDDLTGSDTDIVLMANRLYIFDTSMGEIRHYPLDGGGVGTAVRPAGAGLDNGSKIRFRAIGQTMPVGSVLPPELAIFGMKSLMIPTGTVVRPIGTRALVIVTRGSTTVMGEIDVGAGRAQTPPGVPSDDTPGPGGGRGAIDTTVANAAQGCAPGTSGVNNGGRDTGGGGGGLGTAGGNGGPPFATPAGGFAVLAGLLPTVCAQSNSSPLRGGSGGGAGAQNNDGGGGGGALQLTSFTSISIAGGDLYAGGAGGDGTSGNGGGGAAGSGGGILLEAPAITIAAGSVTATGGAGGAGNSDTDPGQNGQRDGTAAQPSGNGGTGATGPALTEFQAVAGAGNVDGTGGGGGGAGAVHFRALSAAMMSAGPVIHPTPGTSVPTTTM